MRRILATTLAALAGAALANDPVIAGGSGIVIYDASGTMRIRIDRPIHSAGFDRPRREYPFWWWGYQAPGAGAEGEPQQMDPALNAGPTRVHRFVWPGSFDGGYYDLFPYGAWLPRQHSPFAFSWATFSRRGWSPWWRQWGSYNGPVIVGSTRTVDPDRLDEVVEAGPAFEKPVPVPFQVALVRLLSSGEYAGAIDLWRRARSGAEVFADGMPAYPGAEPPAAPVAVDEVWWTDQRLLAVAQAGAGDFDRAGATMREAYGVEPNLASLPLAPQSLAPAGRDLRRLVLDAIDHADRAGSPEAWLLAGVLTQAEGRDRVAARFIGRAEAAGLEPDIAGALYDALGGRPAPEQR
jgi:hypothetical protein